MSQCNSNFAPLKLEFMVVCFHFKKVSTKDEIKPWEGFMFNGLDVLYKINVLFTYQQLQILLILYEVETGSTRLSCNYSR